MLSASSRRQINLPRFRTWRELALFSLVLMELSWVVPWYRALSRATHAVSVPRAFFILGAILMTTLWSVRFMEYLHLKINIKQIVLTVLVIASILIGIKLLLYPYERIGFGELIQMQYDNISSLTVLIPDEFMVTIIILLTFWRGMSLSRIQISPRDVLAKFQLGIVVLFGFILINTLVTKEDIGSLIYIFIFSALLALSSARITVLSHLRGGQRSPFDRRWFAGMLTAVISLVALIVSVVQLSTGQGDFLHTLALGLFLLSVVIVLLVSLPIVILASLVIDFVLGLTGQAAFKFLETLSNSLSQLRVNLEQMVEKVTETLGNMGIFKLFEFISHLTPLFRWALIAGIGLVLFILVGLRIKVLRERANLKESRLMTMSRAELLKHLQNQLKDGLQNLVENVRKLVSGDNRKNRRVAAEIRRIYISLLDLTEEIGHPRYQAQTPQEYLATLEKTFPDCIRDVRKITEAYQKVRYGQVPEDKAEVESIRQSWRNIEQSSQVGEDVGQE